MGTHGIAGIAKTSKSGDHPIQMGLHGLARSRCIQGPKTLRVAISGCQHTAPPPVKQDITQSITYPFPLTMVSCKHCFPLHRTHPPLRSSISRVVGATALGSVKSQKVNHGLLCGGVSLERDDRQVWRPIWLWAVRKTILYTMVVSAFRNTCR